MTLPAKYRAFQKSVDAAKARHLYRVSKCFRKASRSRPFVVAGPAHFLRNRNTHREIPNCASVR